MDFGVVLDIFRRTKHTSCSLTRRAYSVFYAKVPKAICIFVNQIRKTDLIRESRGCDSPQKLIKQDAFMQRFPSVLVVK